MIYTCSHALQGSTSALFSQDVSFQHVNHFLNKVVFTFDDGYKSIFPIVEYLSSHSCNPTILFVATGFIESPAFIWWLELEKYILRNNHLPFFYQPNLARLSYCPILTADSKSLAYRALASYLIRQAPNEQINLMRNSMNISRHTDFSSDFLSWDDLRYLSRLPNVYIGSHSHLHPNFSILSAEQVLDELDTSYHLLWQQLNLRPQSFAFPYGNRDSFLPESYHFASLYFSTIYFTAPYKVDLRSRQTLIRRTCTQASSTSLSRLYARHFARKFA
jgi:peptidoglycan/xylan/chitin deacetylase (PgdA/CDA1 family)